MSYDKENETVKQKGFDYDTRVQEALRNVVRDILIDTSKDGLSGLHHFYITFQTNRSDVHIPKSLREKHPDEITIVMQHQFWDLKVDQQKFEVTLSFNDQLEKLEVPFSSLINFLDPSVKFGLQFVPVTPFIADKKLRSKTKEKNSDEATSNVVTLDAFRKKTDKEKK